MYETKTTIIINAAGSGSRLGLGLPKSLVEVCGHPILEWQLRTMCRPEDRIKIVTGFRADEVAGLARDLFSNIEVLENPDWATTKTAASLSIGMAGERSRCLSLDGDLLVHSDDFRHMVEITENAIGVTAPHTTSPVYVQTDSAGLCAGFSYDHPTDMEWTGLVNFNPSATPPGHGDVYAMISCLLPLQVAPVRCVEVDTPEDLDIANNTWQSIIGQMPRG